MQEHIIGTLNIGNLSKNCKSPKVTLCPTNFGPKTVIIIIRYAQDFDDNFVVDFIAGNHQKYSIIVIKLKLIIPRM